MKYQGVPSTRLERFIRSRELVPIRVAEASHVCRQRLLLWRKGKSSPMVSSIRKLVRGMQEVTGDPTLSANHFFPLDDDD